MKKDILLKRLKLYGISWCISYTMVSLILSLLNISSEIKMYNVWHSNVELIALCFVINLLMLITDTIRDPESPTVQLTAGYFAIQILDVAAPVLLMGGLWFRWFNVFSYEVLYPIVILLAVYFAVFAIFYINSKNTEKELNRRISERKEVMRNDKQNN